MKCKKASQFYVKLLSRSVSCLPIKHECYCAGDWTQILGVFSSKGNIKAEMLAKLLLEATLLSEQAGLFVDFVSCDGATWNRSMWRSFGIGGMKLNYLFYCAKFSISAMCMGHMKQYTYIRLALSEQLPLALFLCVPSISAMSSQNSVYSLSFKHLHPFS